MRVETAESFAERVSAAFTGMDREGYLALFDLPCMVWSDGRHDLRAETVRLHEVWQELEATLDPIGPVEHLCRIDIARPMGAGLTVMRIAAWLHLRDGTCTDPSDELWILRERGGRFGLCGLIAPAFFGLLAPIAPDKARGSGVDPAPPDDASPGPATVEAFLDAMVRSVNEGDRALGRSLLALPFVRFSDDVNGFLHDADDRARMIDAFHDRIEELGGGRTRIDLVAQRPLGRTFLSLRVRTYSSTRFGGDADPKEEIWILREGPAGLQLCGAVNPATEAILETRRHFAHGDELS